MTYTGHDYDEWPEGWPRFAPEIKRDGRAEAVPGYDQAKVAYRSAYDAAYRVSGSRDAAHNIALGTALQVARAEAVAGERRRLAAELDHARRDNAGAVAAGGDPGTHAGGLEWVGTLLAVEAAQP